MGLTRKLFETTRRVVTLATGIPTTFDFDKYIDHSDVTKTFQEFLEEEDSEEEEQ